jgi:hypothetical protein
MERSFLRRSPRRVIHSAVALGIGAASIPVVLGMTATPSAAATNSGNSTISAQQIVADVECDAVWLDWDVTSNLPGVFGPPPTCTPVPAGLTNL